MECTKTIKEYKLHVKLWHELVDGNTVIHTLESYFKNGEPIECDEVPKQHLARFDKTTSDCISRYWDKLDNGTAT